MLSFFEFFVNIFSKKVGYKLSSARVLWHVVFDIVNYIFEDDDLVVILVFLIIFIDFCLGLKYDL